MAKFFPVIGEVVTAFNSAGKVIAAAATVPFNQEAAGQLMRSAGQEWVDYTKESAVACAVRLDGAGLAKGADAASRSVPIVAHGRAIYHLVRDEGEEAYECAMNGTKAIGVIAATAGTIAVTGGFGAPAAAALTGGAAAGAQIAGDGVDTGIRSAVHGEFRSAGTWNGVERAVRTGNAVDIVDAVLQPTQTAAMAAAASASARAAQGSSSTTQPRSGSSLNADNLARLPDRSAGSSSAPSYSSGSGSTVRLPQPSSATPSAASSSSGFTDFTYPRTGSWMDSSATRSGASGASGWTYPSTSLVDASSAPSSVAPAAPVAPAPAGAFWVAAIPEDGESDSDSD